MKVNLQLNSGFEFTTVKTVEVSREVYEWTAENLNFGLEPGMSATFAARGTADALNRLVKSILGRNAQAAGEGFAVPEGMMRETQAGPSADELNALDALADLLAAFTGHHSAIVDFRPNL